MTGAYITRDAGESWRMFHLGGVVEAFAFDPSDASVLYAANSVLWRSEDAMRADDLEVQGVEPDLLLVGIRHHGIL